MIHKIIYAFVLLFATGGMLLAAPNQTQTEKPSKNQQQIVMGGRLDSVNLAEGFIVAMDTRFYVDISTRVYNQAGGLLAKQNLRAGQLLEMYFRVPTAPLSRSRAVLEKIIILREP